MRRAMNRPKGGAIGSGVHISHCCMSAYGRLKSCSGLHGVRYRGNDDWRGIDRMISEWKHLMTPTVAIVLMMVAAATIVFLTWPGNLLLPTASAQTLTGFTEQVSPSAQTNATEPSVAVDRSDGTIYVAWQASGSHVARSDGGGRTFVQTPIGDFFGRDLGDVAIRIGGQTPCAT